MKISTLLRKILFVSPFFILIFFIFLTSSPFAQGSAVIILDAGATYQTISGWEATAEIGQLDFPTEFLLWKDEVITQAVNDLGINRVRLTIRSGTENPVDYYPLYLNGTITRDEFRDHWHEIINDNSNPLVINANGFQFTELDHKIDNIVLPMKQLLEARGEQLYINLNIVDFNDEQGASNTHYQSQPDEYAELVLATFQHLQSTYGWVPDGVEIILEPDIAQWTNGTNVGNALAAAGALLEANGFTPEFIAPSNTSMSNAVVFFDDMIQVTGVLTYLTEFSYHRYSGVSDPTLQNIANRATTHNLDTSMLEHIGSGYDDLHKDLTPGNNSAWQQFVLAYPVSDNGAQYYLVDRSTPSNPVVSMGQRTKFLRQYFKFIRRNAQRISASTNNGNFDPVAFINADGSYVVVVKTSTSGSFSINNLPTGAYGIKYTTNSEYDINLSDITLTGGQALTTSIPASGVLTVYTISAGVYLPVILHN